MPFTQTNPADNPQPNDKLLNPDGSRVAPLVSGPGDRPYGVTGVDKPHGGGTMSLEQEADARATIGAQGSTGVTESRLPGPNPNNPQDVNNPFSTSRVANAQVAAAAGAPYATGTGGPTGPVTTEPLPTKNEETDARLKAAARSGSDRLDAVRNADTADQHSARSDDAPTPAKQDHKAKTKRAAPAKSKSKSTAKSASKAKSRSKAKGK